MRFEPINYNRYKYVDESEMPILALGIVMQQYEFDFKFVNPEKWRYIAHQTAGVGCHSIYMTAMLLPLKEEAKTKILKLHNYWYDTSVGTFGVELSQVCAYQAQLNNTFGLSCETSYSYFKEAIYPFDPHGIDFNQLTEVEIPTDFDTLIEWKNSLSKVMGSIGRWKAFFICENSD